MLEIYNAFKPSLTALISVPIMNLFEDVEFNICKLAFIASFSKSITNGAPSKVFEVVNDTASVQSVVEAPSHNERIATE